MESEQFQLIKQIFELYLVEYTHNKVSSSKSLDNSKLNEQIRLLEHYLQKNKNLSQLQLVGLASIYYVKAVIQDSPKLLYTAISYLQQCKHLTQQTILWRLQLAALYSAFKNHTQSYNIADKVVKNIIQILKQNKSQNPLIMEAINRFYEQNVFSSVWLYNSTKNQQIFNYPSATGYYFPDSFCIADIMSLQITPLHKLTKKVIERQKTLNFSNLIVYLSIGCFTKATQKYYMKDKKQHNYHVKAVALARLICSQKCAYLQFLLTTLIDHFGNILSDIPEQNSQIFQLKRILPKDLREISLKNLDFDQF